MNDPDYLSPRTDDDIGSLTSHKFNQSPGPRESRFTDFISGQLPSQKVNQSCNTYEVWHGT